MAAENEINEYFHHAAKALATAYHHATRDGSVAALGREAIHDVRNTMNEVFFGKGERGAEPGTPLHPLFHDIVQDRKSHEAALGQLATAGQIASAPEEQRGGVHGQPQQGTVQGNIYGYDVATGAGRGDQAHGQAAPGGGGAYGPEKGIYGPERGVYGPEKGVAGHGDAAAPTAGQIAEDKGLEGQHGQGMQVAQLGPSPAPIPGGLAERILNERKDGYQLQRGKVLPDDQLENNKGRDR